MKTHFAPIAAAVCFLVIIVVINTVVACYPSDNDLDGVGWIASNLTLERPESLSNANYPLGLPLLLRVLTPVFGSFLVAGLVCSAVACAVLVLISYYLAMLLDENRSAAILTLLLVGLIVFQSATSEFADSISAALLFGSFYVLLTGLDRWKNHLLAGVLIGVAFVFRYHYQLLAVLIPMCAIVFGGTWKQNLQRIAIFLGGFVLGAMPVLLANMASHGSPFQTGITPYLVGQHSTKSVDWEDYLATYDLWPVSRLVLENPIVLAKHMINNLLAVVFRPVGFAALLLAPTYIRVPGKSTADRISLFLALFVILYLVLVVAPTQVTFRALLPVEAIMGVLIVRGSFTMLAAADLGSVRIRSLSTWLYAGVLLLVVGAVPNAIYHMWFKLEEQRLNQSILGKLDSAGMTSYDEVFSTDYNFYPLEDPHFVTLYNYGGWLLLDSEYARTRPQPHADTAEEWRDFMRKQELRFLVIHETPKTECFLNGEFSADEWRVVGQDSKFTVLELLPEAS